MTDLESVHVTSGVNDKGRGFCTVAAHSTNGLILVGQLAPDEVRRMAMDWLEAAEAADQDAAVLRVSRKLGIDDRFAGLIINDLRTARNEDEP